MRTPEEARAFPSRELSLAVCEACGFITNPAFDPAVQCYSDRYEENQGYSPRFRTFLESLVEDLIDRYGIRGKRIVEIGCGKGEFLALLCERGDNEGIGFDPAYVPGRFSSHPRGRVRFVRDRYPEDAGPLEADVVCCRHTLEHIPDTRCFVRALRTSLDARPDSLVFVEVPDAGRVLDEAAFWDVYYEHCSYFTGASLGRLFRDEGFDLQRQWRDYDDQYLLLAATPASRGARARPEPAANAETLAAAERFGTRCGRLLTGWRRFVDGVHRNGGRIVLWGSGSKGVAFLCALNRHDSIDAVVDVNPHRQGSFMPGTGHEIVAPESLIARRPSHVIVMNPIYRREIRTMLEALGLGPAILALPEPDREQD